MSTVRSLLRRAVRPLPAGAQIAIRELRERVAGTYDSAPVVRALRERGHTPEQVRAMARQVERAVDRSQE